MAPRVRAAILVGAAVWCGAQQARAQPADEDDDEEESAVEDGDALVDGDPPPWVLTGEPPEGYDEFQVVDLTVGMRDDYFTSAVPEGDGKVWVSTWNGRSYFSDDNGLTWRETTIIPDRRSLYGFAGQRILLGALRSDAGSWARPINLGGEAQDERNYRLLFGDVTPTGSLVPDEAAAQGRLTTGRQDRIRHRGTGRGAIGPLNVFGGEVPIDALAPASEGAVGAGSGLLAAGLSSRAPRLSLLLTIMRRPTAVISLQRLLLTAATRSPAVYAVYRSAADPGRLFAQTGNGLYQSVDDGMSWLRVFPGPNPAERNILRIAFDPKQPQRVYMGTARGLYISDDGGLTWKKNTRVPEIMIKWVTTDPENPDYVYVGGNGGVYRSSNRGQDFVMAYYDSLRARRDVNFILVDPFDPNTGYLGTSDGVMVTHNLRESRSDDWELLSGLRTGNLVAKKIDACSRHPGHLYLLTTAALPTINYGAHGPETLLLETWDYGKTWRPLAGNRTQGDISAFVVDGQNPDTVWVAFSRAIARVERTADIGGEAYPMDVDTLTLANRVLPSYPALSHVVDAALDHHGLSLDLFTDKLDRLRYAKFVPSHVNVTFQMGRWGWGAAQQDIRFPFDDRYRALADHDAWRVMAYATWSLPEIVHQGIYSSPMLRFRVLTMNDQLRGRILQTVYRNYGELQRLLVRQRTSSPDRDLYVRAVEHVRIEYLEAVVDLASGGYLTEWKQKAGR